MPAVTMRIPAKQHQITKRMPTPKKVGTLKQWLKTAIKYCPEIPNPYDESTGWQVLNEDATPDLVSFELQHINPNKFHNVYITIDRNISYFGSRF